ncbi:MAG: hypothetical protein N2606_00265 [Candidatus Omnitrophica bacterium]|nr:hypothetical protein [Candidatus Omnitrophota bacterium]
MFEKIMLFTICKFIFKKILKIIITVKITKNRLQYFFSTNINSFDHFKTVFFEKAKTANLTAKPVVKGPIKSERKLRDSEANLGNKRKLEG